jgi:hypothetical protein
MTDPASDFALAGRPPARPRPFSRLAFRRRLDRDPRRWVLALAAAEGLAWLGLFYEGKIAKPGPGYLLAVGLGFALVAPALGVLFLYVQARVLYWAGRLLGGQAKPVAIRAALAWSQVPTLIVGWPATIFLFTKAAAAESEPVPAPLLFANDLLRSLTAWSSTLSVFTGLLGVVLYVLYLSEVQGFTGLRAVANHVLAVILAALVLGAGLGLGWAVSSL